MSDNIKNEDIIEQIAKAIKTAEANISIDELIKNLDENKRKMIITLLNSIK
ncbi:MAG: hypothetical protein J6E38_02475 [Clostridia bacterium]|nr:hypothetical protein [Clostridia bacterium]